MYFRNLFIFLLLYQLFILSSCQSNSVFEDTKKITEQYSEEPTSQPAEEIEEQPVQKENLFPEDKLYDHTKVKEITVNGQQVPATFYDMIHTHYGAYIPEMITVVDFEDGTEFQLSQREFINLTPIDLSLENISDFDSARKSAQKIAEEYGAIAPFSEEKELKIYQEYLGSKIYDENGARYDFFLFQYNQQENALIRLRYFIEDKNKVLPLFLDIIKHFKYIEPREKQEPILPQEDFFPDDKLYDNTDTIEMTVDGEKIAGTFRLIQSTSYGIYIPDTFQTNDLDNGMELQFFQQENIVVIGEQIAIIPIDLNQESSHDFTEAKQAAQTLSKEYGNNGSYREVDDLKRYNEYLGTKIDEEGRRNDFFLFRYHPNGNALVILTYDNQYRREILPILLDVIKHIKYIPLTQ